MQHIYESKYLPSVTTLSVEDNTHRFRLAGVDVSFANGLRRTMLSNIPMVVFRTTPKEKNKCTILVNTSRFNNEIIKQRLGCIPIYIRDVQEFPLDQYHMELSAENTSDTILHVTTGDFRIKHKSTGEYLSEEKTAEIFPRHPLSRDFISFLYLRPKISDSIPGEAIRLTCDFDIATAEEDSMYNAVCTCAFANTEDEDRQERELAKLRQVWKEEGGKTPDEVEFESANWRLLEAKRIFKRNSFDFVLETVGPLGNVEIASTACEVLQSKFVALRQLTEKGKLLVKPSVCTIPNSFDVTLEHEDYTVGKILEHLLHVLYFERDAGKQQLSYCGFIKMHPHDTFSIIRVAFDQKRDPSIVHECVQQCCITAETVLSDLRGKFARLRIL